MEEIVDKILASANPQHLMAIQAKMLKSGGWLGVSDAGELFFPDFKEIYQERAQKLPTQLFPDCPEAVKQFHINPDLLINCNPELKEMIYFELRRLEAAEKPPFA